jgi:hypothetical protein
LSVFYNLGKNMTADESLLEQVKIQFIADKKTT